MLLRKPSLDNKIKCTYVNLNLTNIFNFFQLLHIFNILMRTIIFIFRPLPEDTEVHSPKPTTSSSGKKGRSGTHKSASKRVKDELWLGK